MSTIKNSMESSKKRVLITGGTGLIGTRVIELLSDTYEFVQISRSTGVDITQPETFSQIDIGDAAVLIHLAAKADVDVSEGEKDKGEESDCWRMNVIGTKNIATFCQQNNLKIFYISTDFVFDGEKREGEGYIEDDTPNPINFYGQSKYEGEKMVRNSGAPYIILRIAYPYRKEFEQKGDFVRSIIKLLQDGTKITAVMDQIICPTFIDDIAFALKLLIEKNERGIFHCVGQTPITPYDAIIKIAQLFNFNNDLITPVTREEFYAGKAKRPFNLYLKNDKIQRIGFTPMTFSEGIEFLR